MFYLDDGVLAGSVDAVTAALSNLQRAAAGIGPTLNLDKSEAIAVGMTPAAALTAKLASALVTASDGASRVLHDFEFLGAAIGGPAFLQQHATGRVAAARKLLEAIGALEDPQVALRLLRACAGYARLVHTMRCCPPAGHEGALAQFDGLVQECFSSFTGLHVEPSAWEQASRGWARLGWDYAPPKPRVLAHGFAVSLMLATGLTILEMFAAALSAFNTLLAPAQHLTAAAALRLTQKELSRRVDDAGWHAQLRTASAVGKATLFSEASEGARAFLTCVPSGRTHMEPSVLVFELRVRLALLKPQRTPGAPNVTPSWTHMGIMLACTWLVERTLRHNALRDLVHSWAERGCLRLNVKKLGYFSHNDLMMSPVPDAARRCVPPVLPWTPNCT